MEAFYASEFKSNFIKAEPIARNLMDDGMSKKEAWEIAYPQVGDEVWVTRRNSRRKLNVASSNLVPRSNKVGPDGFF